MTTRLQKQIDQLITHRASEWLEVLKSGDAAQNEAFIRWIAESPRHMEEFLALVALDHELPALKFGSRFDLDAVKAQAASSAVTPLATTLASDPTYNAPRTKKWKWAAGMAASIAIVAASALLIQSGFWQWQNFETAVGEQRSVQLLDGSQIHINTQSRIRVRLDSGARDIRLVHGEALFKVAHDAARPFRVLTRDGEVQVLGTEFNVYSRPSSTTIAVLEGKVQVSSESAAVRPAALSAGEAARIGHDGTIEHVMPANVTQAVAWRERRLIFDRTPLEEVAEEFNRYNRSTQLRLEGIPAGSRHYSGDFNADDPESLGAFLSREPDLSVDHRDGRIVIRLR